MAYCGVKNGYGFQCGNLAAFAVYLEPEDAQPACGKHLARLVAERIAASAVKFVKVATLSSR